MFDHEEGDEIANVRMEGGKIHHIICVWRTYSAGHSNCIERIVSHWHETGARAAASANFTRVLFNVNMNND